MNPEAWAAAISAIGLLFSWTGSALIVGARWGNVKTRLDMLERQLPQLATREQLAGVKEDLAEIKGMFRMVPKDGAGSGAAVP